MQLGMCLRLQQLCVLCEESIEDHKETCPIGQLNRLIRLQRRLPCPVCRGGVDINSDDYFECRKCHTRFTSGKIVVGHDPDGLPEVIIFDGNMEPIHAYILPEKGKGQFRFDEQIAHLEKIIKAALRRKKRRKS